MRAPSLTGFAQAGFAWYEADGDAGGMLSVIMTPGRRAVVVRSDALPGMAVNVAFEEPASFSTFAVAYDFNDPGFGQQGRFVGNYMLVIWWQGDAAFEWRVTAAGATTPGATDQGAAVHLYSSRDFEAVDRLIGVYVIGVASVAALSITTPDGERDCSSYPVSNGLLWPGIREHLLVPARPGATGPWGRPLRAQRHQRGRGLHDRLPTTLSSPAPTGGSPPRSLVLFNFNRAGQGPIAQSSTRRFLGGFPTRYIWFPDIARGGWREA